MSPKTFLNGVHTKIWCFCRPGMFPNQRRSTRPINGFRGGPPVKNKEKTKKGSRKKRWGTCSEAWYGDEGAAAITLRILTLKKQNHTLKHRCYKHARWWQSHYDHRSVEVFTRYTPSKVEFGVTVGFLRYITGTVFALRCYRIIAKTVHEQRKWTKLRRRVLIRFYFE